MKRFATITALALSLVLAAGSSAAIGTTRPDDRATHGLGALVTAQQIDVVRPDDRATHGQGAITGERRSTLSRPDDQAIHGPGATAARPVLIERVPVVAPARSETQRVDGFDWLDAAIGAVAAVGLGLILAGGAAFVLRRTHDPAYP